MNKKGKRIRKNKVLKLAIVVNLVIIHGSKEEKSIVGDSIQFDNVWYIRDILVLFNQARTG